MSRYISYTFKCHDCEKKKDFSSDIELPPGWIELKVAYSKYGIPNILISHFCEECKKNVLKDEVTR